MKWIVASVPFAIFLLVATANAASAGGTLWTRKPTSFAPVIGGVGGAAALLIAPWSRLHAFWWLPMCLDLGCGLTLLATLIGLLIRLRSRANSTPPENPGGSI